MKPLQNKTYDAIVIGSGPGGGSVAREMSRQGKKVLILERGKDPIVKGSPFQTLPTFKPFKTTEKATITTQSVAGGATFSYCACALEPRYDAFNERGIDLKKYVTETIKELAIAPLPDRLIGPMSQRVMDSALDLGIDWQKIPKIINSSKCHSGCWKCTYNCPYGAKWTAREFVMEAADNRGDFITSANVDKIIVENCTATGVIYTTNTKSFRVNAPLVILSAGGMYSPKLLEKAGIEGVGKNFFFDPLLVVTGFVKDVKGGLREIPMSAGVSFPEEGYLLTDFASTGLMYFQNIMSSGKFSKIFSGRNALTILVKIRDELSGNISEKGPVNKALGEVEKKRFKQGIKLAEKILKNAGAQSTFNSAIAGSHPGGTIKIGEFVDQNLRTQIDNLYVCDASVIPVAWGLPPVLTLIALGKRLARHLVTQSMV